VQFRIQHSKDQVYDLKIIAVNSGFILGGCGYSINVETGTNQLDILYLDSVNVQDDNHLEGINIPYLAKT